MAANPLSVPRLHALDSLRAIMMLLGIWIHASATYAVAPLDPVWYPKDPHTNRFFDYAFFFIHSFRMPLFFVLAGFFALLLYRRYGPASFLRHRARRIVFPFLLGWVLLYIPSVAGVMYSLYAFHPDPAADVLRYLGSPDFRRGLGTIHLWFLYYLVFFYIAAVILAALAARWLSAPLQQRADSTFRILLTRWWGPVVLAVPTAGLLALMHSATIDTSAAFLIPPRMLAAYGMFFGFGWMLFRHADLLHALAPHAWKQVALAAVLLPIQARAEMAVKLSAPGSHSPARLIAILTGALAVWLLVFGLTGLFLRYGSRESPRMRYLADASYWMYLAHLPIVVWLQIPLLYVDIGAFWKCAVVLTVTVAVLLVTYQFGVRYTALGNLLNGPRAPRSA